MRSKRGVEAGATKGAASRSFQDSVPPLARGSAIERLMARFLVSWSVRRSGALSDRQLRHIDPAPLLPARQRRLDQLDALGAFLERPLVPVSYTHLTLPTSDLV